MTACNFTANFIIFTTTRTIAKYVIFTATFIIFTGKIFTAASIIFTAKNILTPAEVAAALREMTMDELEKVLRPITPFICSRITSENVLLNLYSYDAINWDEKEDMEAKGPPKRSVYEAMLRTIINKEEGENFIRALKAAGQGHIIKIIAEELERNRPNSNIESVTNLVVTNMDQAKLDEELIKLSLSLIPSRTETEDKISKAEKIYQLLRTKSKYNLDRYEVVGSVGKGTALSGRSDLDIIFFLNWDKEEDPPFAQVREEVRAMLVQSKMQVTLRTSYGIKVKFEDLDADVIFAQNFVDNSLGILSPSILNARQALHILENIQQKHRKNNYRHRAGLSVNQMKFVQEQKPFVHHLIRLCKYWVKTKDMGNVSCMSTLIELIAIHVGIHEQGIRKEKPSVGSAFEMFLRIISDFENLAIEFDYDPLNAIRNETELVKRISPYVIDSVNIFNDLTTGLLPENVDHLKLAAETTLEHLRHFEDGKSVRDLIGERVAYYC